MLAIPDAEAVATKIGIIVVHGIGEQKRFEHLNGHVRGLIAAIRRRPNTNVSVDILGSPAAAFQAAQDSWHGGPEGAIRLSVEQDGKLTEIISVHEVWWADVNEPYSIAKQLRFWGWGLSLWALPRRTETGLASSPIMFCPRPGEGNYNEFWVRLQLFLVGTYFLVASLSLGVLTVVLKRLLQIEAFDTLKVIPNYVSSVKLYNQKHRASGDFLDAIGDPPRVSIRRRMLRAIGDVACRRYDRWYILAHSQGAVVAFNGLMEPGSGWPGYLDQDRWDRLRNEKMAGPASAPLPRVEPNPQKCVPARPVWVKPDEIAYRSRIFRNFRGLLTYGCPLEKFAAIWPGSVPVCQEPAFQSNSVWLNVFDPMDPVSGVMKNWPTEAPEACPRPDNIGYAASNVLLLGHLKYVEDSGARATTGNLADAAATWILRDDAGSLRDAKGARFFEPSCWRRSWRICLAWLWWAATYVLFALIAGWIAPWVLRHATPGFIKSYVVQNYGFVQRIATFSIQPDLCHPGAMSYCSLAWRTGLTTAAAVVVILVSGGILRLGMGKNCLGDRQPADPFTVKPSPDPLLQPHDQPAAGVRA